MLNNITVLWLLTVLSGQSTCRSEPGSGLIASHVRFEIRSSRSRCCFCKGYQKFKTWSITLSGNNKKMITNYWIITVYWFTCHSGTFVVIRVYNQLRGGAGELFRSTPHCEQGVVHLPDCQWSSIAVFGASTAVVAAAEEFQLGPWSLEAASQCFAQRHDDQLKVKMYRERDASFIYQNVSDPSS